MKKIVVFGAGKSATCLIDFLIKTCEENDWELTVADGDRALAASKTGQSASAKAVGVNVEDEEERSALIKNADIVISLLPPALHSLIAGDCVAQAKNLLTASYTDDPIRELAPEIERKGLLLLCEMGLDPGIDHMSAMQLIHRIQHEGGMINAFRSHCGGLVAPESDDNPWHYKISWNPRNVVLAGSAGAVFKEKSDIKNIPYQSLFKECGRVRMESLEELAFYPNRDSLSYIPLYGLEGAHTFIRTTLRYPAFCDAWQHIVKAGLTNDKGVINTAALTFKQWSQPILPFVTAANERQFAFLGLFDETIVPVNAKTSADVLQYLLETRLAMQSHDKDMIVMLHEFDYTISGRQQQLTSSLIVKGEDNVRTAMAKTVGLPLGIAAKLILQGKITVKGLHIPIIPEIYEPVMKELEKEGIVFKESILY
ncbi:MAG TPA: saccharopine dehydrogenase family protein [Chitinophagaceae bacterium]|nr:saccharopine dehydrogenase family protein [Chitinophagaceae bacterium]